MRRIAIGLLVGLVTAGSAQGASLFLRVADSGGGAEVAATVGEPLTLEIVVTLGEGEALGFASLFLDTDTADDGEIVEALDFQPGLPEPASYTQGHNVSSGGEPFPFEAGAGVSLEQYQLNMQTGDQVVDTGTEVVLERVAVNPLAAGTVAISIEMGGRAPSFFSPDFTAYQVAPPETPADLDGFLYLGVGDAREGGAGALVLQIMEAGGNENDNVVDNVNDNEPPENENDNGRNEGPRADGGSSFCGFGMLGPMLGCAGMLGLLAGRKRR